MQRFFHTALLSVCFLFAGYASAFAQSPSQLLWSPLGPLANNDLEMAFMYAEKSKSAVLLSSIKDEQAKMGRIPQEARELEKSLKIDMAFYRQKLAERQDSATEARFQTKLFLLSRSYDSLVKVFEKEFPEYYNLKHNFDVVSVKDVQAQLEKDEMVISYLQADTVMLIFKITAKKFDVEGREVPERFEGYMQAMRNGILYEDPGTYATAARKLSEFLIPEIPKKVKRLVFLPEGRMGTLPFEAFLTEDYQGEDFTEMPYLINDYDVAYHYSATLWVNYAKKKAREGVNGFVAFAPVFADETQEGVVQRSPSLMEDLQQMDTIRKRSMFNNRNMIAAIPATETEVRTIYRLFDDRDFPSSIYTHKKASETNLKNDDFSRFRYVHFATHGFVNEEKPELSGLMLATPDSTTGQDGVLFLGEIYNLRLDADLVTLSACETGLGKISRGEGIIGLTRALLYAGARNVMVSLWKVADASTGELMVNFYTNILEARKNTRISAAMREAKLSMIKEQKYANPYYWSPFIMVGR